MDDESLLIGFAHHHQYPAEEKKNQEALKKDIFKISFMFLHLPSLETLVVKIRYWNICIDSSQMMEEGVGLGLTTED